MRLGCSKLNQDLKENVHVRENGACYCGYHKEDAEHYLFNCPIYADARATLFNSLPPEVLYDTDAMLYGSDDLDLEQNLLMFRCVQNYIANTNRLF
jgi:hypothetical protein